MITMIAHMRVAPENAAKYEALLSRVTACTLRNEPGVPYYAWSQSAEEPGLYVVIEVYADAEAHAAHMASEWVQVSLPDALHLVEGKIEIQQYVSPGQEPVSLKYG